MRVHVVDPGGHRLLTFGRNWDGDDVWHGRPGGTTLFFVEDRAEGIVDWWLATDTVRLLFGCKTCRDQGGAWWTAVSYAAVEARLGELWNLPHDHPRSARLCTVEAPTDTV